MIRLAHISDLHLTIPGLDWRWHDWLNKRLFTWMNLRVFGRGARFAQGERILRRLGTELAERPVDRVVFSGDATALGFEAELAHTARVLDVGRLAGLAVPGNHDYCTPAVARSGAFERVFGPWQHGERIGDHTYPFAQRVGSVWLVGVNSSKGNRWFFDATGRTGREQLERLRQLLERLAPGPRILVTHYPICLASGRREGFTHGLNDLRRTVDVAAAGGVGLWLHGHRHAFYWFQRPSFAPFPVICAGSTTQRGLWSYGEYEIDGARLRGLRREYDATRDVFRDAERFELTLTRG
jgi:3',5'-cyclic AMP phosphodiesterase CpdA